VRESASQPAFSGATLVRVRLSTDGDSLEQYYWNEFIADRFPSYEAFWLAGVVHLTRRSVDRRDIRFLSPDELAATGRARTDEEVAVAQLHYTTLIHLGRVYGLLRGSEPVPGARPRVLPGPGSAVLDTRALSATEFVGLVPSGMAFVEPGERSASRSEPHTPSLKPAADLDFDVFTEAFARLAAASDVADELLGRRAAPGKYPPWDESKGKQARWDWRNTHGDPLKPIREYRNRLLHGRVLPRLIERGTSKYPRIDKVNDYLDWRQALGQEAHAAVLTDFDQGHVVVSDAWDQAITYVETTWSKHLLAS
jgi:hypothetical protein